MPWPFDRQGWAVWLTHRIDLQRRGGRGARVHYAGIWRISVEATVSFVLSTESVPTSDRLAYWHDVVTRTFVPLDVVTAKDVSFSGTVVTDQLGPMRISTVDAEAERVRRTPPLIAQSGSEYFTVGLQGRGPALVAQGGRTAALRPGDLAFYDTTEPYTLSFPSLFQMKVFQVPRKMLGLPLSDLHRVTGVLIQGDEAGLGALVSPFLSKLASEAGSYQPEVADRLARNAVDLLSTLVAERLGQDAAGAEFANRAMSLRIRAFIAEHLCDPDLSPSSIAAAHHISVRYVHRLFQDEDTTVSRWIQRRRLEECHHELSRTGRRSPAIAAVAHRWGFSSPAHFSRAFRAEYGMSPREWQASARLA